MMGDVMGNIERSEDDYMPISERWPDGVVPMGEYENVLERARLAEGVADSLHEQLRGAVAALEQIADPPMGDDYSAPREYAEWLRDRAQRALDHLRGR